MQRRLLVASRLARCCCGEAHSSGRGAVGTGAQVRGASEGPKEADGGATTKNSTEAPAIDFADHEGAFRGKSTWEVARALAILRLCALDVVVDNSLNLMRGAQRVLGRRCAHALLRPTLYDQFVGGASGPDVRSCVQRLTRNGARAMLAATMEEDVGESRGSDAVYDGNCARIVEAMTMSSATPQPMVQLKLSGLLPADLLVILGDMYSSTDDKMLLIRRVAARLSGSTTDTDSLSHVLDKTKEKVLDKALKRLKRIAQEAQNRRVKVLVDAEYTYLNPGLSLLALAAASLYNKDTALFWNTYQCYLKDARQKLEQELAILSSDMGVHFGAKIVRGAYMEQERRRAQRLRMPDPVCPDYAATGRNFDTVVSFLLEKAAVTQSRCELIVASHNEQSIKFAIHKMNELKIGRTDGIVSFGQLFGMSDQLTYPLANCGYSVYKSVPYGTMEEVLPYLARRAAENKSVLQGARKEQALLALELKMRFLRRFGILKTAWR